MNQQKRFVLFEERYWEKMISLYCRDLLFLPKGLIK